jgi:Hint domain
MSDMQPTSQPPSRARRHFLAAAAAAAAVLASPLASTALAKPAVIFKRKGTVYEGGDISGQMIGKFRRRLVDEDGDGTIDVKRGTGLNDVIGDQKGTFTSREWIIKKADKGRDGVYRVSRLMRTRTVHRSGPPHCFLPGTCILTSRGEVPVEELRIGDQVVTVRGEAKPIKWIGRQSFKKSGPAWQDSVMPIRIARGALDENTPHQDLYTKSP